MNVRGCFAVLLLAFLVPMAAEAAEQELQIGLYGDVSAVDALWTEHVYLHGGITVDTGSRLVLEMPVTYVRQEDGHAALDTGLLLKYDPFDNGFWLGATLFQGVTLLGEDRPDDWYIYMQEFSCGYTHPVGGSWYVEPSLALRDLTGVFHDSLSSVSEYAAGYSRLRFCLNFGWRGVGLTLPID